MKMTEEQAYKAYNNALDGLYPLEGIACKPFSQLLQAGDPIAYNCGFADYCNMWGLEIE